MLPEYKTVSSVISPPRLNATVISNEYVDFSTNGQLKEHIWMKKYFKSNENFKQTACSSTGCRHSHIAIIIYSLN